MKSLSLKLPVGALCSAETLPTCPARSVSVNVRRHPTGRGLTERSSTAEATTDAPSTRTASDVRVTYDVNLTVLQLCRTALLAATIVAAIVATGSTNAPYIRVASTASASACFISHRFYARISSIRRLPREVGYSFESNTIVEALRATNWAIVVSLLAWVSLLLRGPFETETTTRGWIWRWTYTQWCVWGPMMMGVSSLFILPGWKAAALARRSDCVRKRMAWSSGALILLVVSLIISWTVQFAIISSSRRCNTCARTDSEYRFGVLICNMWWAYTIVSVIRTLYNTITEYASQTCMQICFSSESADQLATACFPCAQFWQYTFLTLVLAPLNNQNMETMRRIAVIADDEGSEQLLFVDHRSETTQLPVTEAAASHLCTQLVDVVLAIVDISAQVVTAVGCAALVIPTYSQNEIHSVSECCT